VSDPVLSAMNRRSDRARIERMVRMLREGRRYLALRTTYIVGFPGETEAQFGELAAFVRDFPFDHVGAFMYSAEEGTAAERMPGQISERVKRRRLDRLMGIQQQVLRELNRRHVGRTYPVLVEEALGEGRYRGRTEYQAPGIDSAVTFACPRTLSPGQFADVTIGEVKEYDWIGACAHDTGQ
jgi:ribosomal protein S12 methylthiotransferase